MFKQTVWMAVALVGINAGALEKPWGAGKTLGEKKTLGAAKVCTDGKNHYVARVSVDLDGVGSNDLLYTGDAKKLVQVRGTPNAAGGGSFFEPRYFNPTANDDFRGIDFRNYGLVSVDDEKKTCEVTCGTHKVPLKLMEQDKARELLLAVALEENPQQFEPVTLLRDTKSRYYLIERSVKAGGEKNFRLWLGPKGSMAQQKLTNTVTDSEGQIFSTRDGELRLLLDNVQPSFWVEGKKKTELRAIPLGPNYALIYNELGVYRGARLGTPCDDL